jgi:hypothetical protein
MSAVGYLNWWMGLEITFTGINNLSQSKNWGITERCWEIALKNLKSEREIPFDVYFLA